jgi:hypothetical protein
MNLKNISLAILALFALSFTNPPQECLSYFPLTKGSSWEYEEFDKNGELSGTNITTVVDVKEVNGNMEFILKGVTDGPKKKEKNHHEQSFSYVCDNGVLKMSMEGMIPQETMEGMKDMEMEITQTEMMLPATLNAGDVLDDASVTMKVSSNGMTVMTMTVNITDRKVEKFEEVTTKAGTFNCAVISYNTHTDMGIMKMDASAREWFSPKVGMVKSENFDKKGNLESSRVLSAFKAG